MFIIRCLFLTIFLTCFNRLDALATDNATTLTTHNIFTHELALSQNPYKIAKATFLPETYDDLGLSGRYNTKYDFNKESCDAYTLSSCPTHGICTKCPFNTRKFKLNACEKGWKINQNRCLADSCLALNKNYLSYIPSNMVCTKITQIGLTCYKDCREISCAGFKRDCDSISNENNVASFAICDDCKSITANCSPKMCKITGCDNNMKANSDGTACVEKDDTCPEGYYKECQTGTVGDPQFTEKGTACYKCQARTCANGKYNLNLYWCNGALKCLLPAN